MTTRRFITSAVLSAVLIATGYSKVRAEDDGQGSLPFCCCSYNMWTCTYNDGSYWDGCENDWEISQIFTFVARGRCKAWHPAPVEQ